jgi:hypothetical protein
LLWHASADHMSKSNCCTHDKSCLTHNKQLTYLGTHNQTVELDRTDQCKQAQPIELKQVTYLQLLKSTSAQLVYC